ncbi:1-acyl-sn-glycerol-3-phosphate acyltransferase [Asticcacaulis sp. AND118]|uniref:lysophospholipid acyltransferase family protein n=1 Tax=Asticcacaulis sp. AND118 TaxID=2840468 RepID=UPI001CFFAB79|nr:lysophospholipid acyltransferase family protein [Asticcacaulis sp. AND118]UDF03891.1 1-acyl-sn-glycerol-3-phosphate acyltransferase [Asticcacaulis sp. AND118]
MNFLRSVVFMVWLYGLIVLVGVLGTPFIFISDRMAMRAVRFWAQMVLFGLRLICGVKVEFRGLEHRPEGAALIAGKHLSMLDTIAPFVVLDNPCFVLKKELTYLPFFGWYIWRTKMIPIRRADAAKALKAMVIDARDRLAHGRQILIFAEGTRSEVGADPEYKPGVAALYRDLETPCHLLATNSGQCWPAHGITRKPGTVVFEFLPPVPAGLKRGEFMSEIKTRIEAASNALIAENGKR